MKLFTILLTLLLVPYTLTFGQAIDETVVYGGLKFDQNVYGSATGVGFRAGKGIWAFLSAGPSNDGAEIATEGVYLLDRGNFSFGPVLGGGVDWQDYVADDLDPIAYWIGAVGWLAAYRFADDFGVWGVIKRRQALEENSYEPNTQFALGLYLKLP